MKSQLKSLSWAVALVLLGACSKITRIEVKPAALAFHAAKQAQALQATAVDQNGKPMNGVSLTYASSNARVATVDATGKVTAVKSGAATVTVSSGTVSQMVAVNVTIPAMLMLRPTALVGTGSTAPLAAMVMDDAGRPYAGANVVFGLANPAIAKITGNVVTALAPGQTQITATFGNLRAQAPLSVTLPAFASVEVAPATVRVKVGSGAAVTTKVTDSAGAGVNGVGVTYDTSDAAIATVNAAGMILGVAPGHATVTAHAGDKTATVAVTVTK